MRAFLQKIREKGCEAVCWVKTFVRAEKTGAVAREVLLALMSVVTAWGGWNAVQIAVGNREGVAANILPDTIPFLLSGVLYVDRFAAVFGVVLAAAVLLSFLERSRGAFWRGVQALVLVLGVISASTPFTLVAWVVLSMIVLSKDVPQKSRLGFLLSMGAIALAVLVLSGGAFLAEMTIVATVSSQLPPVAIFFALTLLFAGSLWSIRSLSGAYFLIPAYITLRLCLFFLGTAPALLLSGVALLALLFAKREILARDAHAFGRTSLYLLFMCVPLTMISVELQVITAVQCFLFGGLAIMASGVLTDTSTRWSTAWKSAGTWLTRFVQSPIPGTLMGGGALLVLAGFIALGEATTGMLEMLYLLVLAALFLGALVFMGRALLKHEVAGGSGVQLSGPLQALLLLGGGVGFAHMLALLGTTLGGESPDSVVAIAFTQQTFSFIPWLCTVVSVAIIALIVLLQKKQPAVWDRVKNPVNKALHMVEVRYAECKLGGAVCTRAQQSHSALNASLARIEERAKHMTLKESGVLILACFVITLIVLF